MKIVHSTRNVHFLKKDFLGGTFIRMVMNYLNFKLKEGILRQLIWRMLVIINIMVIYLLEAKCKVYLLFLIPDQDGHGFQFKIVQKLSPLNRKRTPNGKIWANLLPSQVFPIFHFPTNFVKTVFKTFLISD